MKINDDEAEVEGGGDVAAGGDFAGGPLVERLVERLVELANIGMAATTPDLGHFKQSSNSIDMRTQSDPHDIRRVSKILNSVPHLANFTTQSLEPHKVGYTRKNHSASPARNPGLSAAVVRALLRPLRLYLPASIRNRCEIDLYKLRTISESRWWSGDARTVSCCVPFSHESLNSYFLDEEAHILGARLEEQDLESG
ncbi:hypothetical protein DSL72_006892 [Monilinia vaccinii-corymbosi]|uniref:Uncharacterized protein n=1 Tax=Monilinia vaccinii-corymbosi TaxID=61207 RepID=A0A8A3PKY2_9HELO|nr:hypothetical protein DSL72_006892 [Monilinia vaccinii-corymbosi]